VLQLNYCIAYINEGLHSWSLQSFARSTLSDYVPKPVKIPQFDIPVVINSSISNLNNLPAIQNNNPADVSSAPPRTNQGQPGQPPPPPGSGNANSLSGQVRVKPQASLQPSPDGWVPGTNLLDTVNEKINKKNNLWNKVNERINKKEERKKNKLKIQGVINDNPITNVDSNTESEETDMESEESDTENENPDYDITLEPNKRQQEIMNIAKKYKKMEEDDRSDRMSVYSRRVIGNAMKKDEETVSTKTAKTATLSQYSMFLKK
jgi:hypothetical protein